ncbi:peptide chain release factor N(5)-glutamine methyltransferase [Brumimicrobium glaciale]|uniref:peptide chain release factor N(5)-glutamine methyltransferase n=1 Tax=Brumimicrobium glaciale TaxID=200475 RepID=A0A4Q4KCR1_9FLAO|nr:peptide chain release factor N(5)-glutamine methyltransferase [Brumimicrobium glaciale]RYM30792.1 peptide chain release factor N(5)-glutamine methyltransferase [Brumimicrobium glaciale]
MYTVNEMLNRFSEKLSDVFIDREKRQIAKMFLMQYMQYDASEMLLNNDQKVPEDVQVMLEHAVAEINNGKPVQYVLGVAYFYDLELKIDRRALIPRPETEELAYWIVEKWKDRSPKILDVGTGSGCIALALKSHIPKSKVFGVDVIQNALDLANENAIQLKLNVQFDFANALNLHAYSHYKWDMIVSNPPYIPLDDKENMKDHVLDHEPDSALFVPNNNPLLYYKAISLYARDHLVPKGSLYFEVHEEMAKEVEVVLNSYGFSKVEIRQDLQGKDRMIHAQF